jgi:23S rRNA pseudouridine1911/1915/1917 synthase
MGGISRSKMQALILAGNVMVNDKLVTNSGYYLKVNDRILISDDFVIEKPELIPSDSVQFSILYEDEDLIVINKPAGVVVHPGAGNRTNTLVNGLVYRFGDGLSKGSDKFRPGIIHRIDKDTSGILVIAKNDYTHNYIAKQFAIHSIIRKYICFCHSVPVPLNDKIKTLIARDKKNRLRMSVSNESGKNAITVYKTIKTFSTFASKIECELKTGRTHQIRVHMSSIGCSLVGDSLYRYKNYSVPKSINRYVNTFPRQALHAYLLDFVHPRLQKTMHFEVEIPNDLKELEDILSSTLV